MDKSILIPIIAIIVIFAIFIIECRSTWQYNRSVKHMLKLIDAAQRMDNFNNENSVKTVIYSEKLLNFIKTYTAQITLLRFHQFMDSHKTEKITRMQIKGLIEEIATEVNKGINDDNINYANALITNGFVKTYIIETVVITVKELLSKSIDSLDDIN